jgi:hypothetical protein
MALLAGLAAVVGANVWLLLSVYVPVTVGPQVEYVLLGASVGTFIVATAVSLLALLVAHRLVWPAGRGPVDLSPRSVEGFLPLALGVAPLTGLLALVVPDEAAPPAWWYVTVDLQPALLAVAVALCGIRLDRLSDGRLRRAVVEATKRLMSGDRTFLFEAALVTIALGFAFVSSPLNRFSPSLHGDEPKYLRFCENLYQGNGFDLRRLTNLDALPVDFSPPLLRNVSDLGAQLLADIRQLGPDAATLLTEGVGHRFNRARYAGNLSVEGRTGGIFQLHSPGLSFLLLPGYIIDRHHLSWDNRFHDHFPTTFDATQTTLLLLYGLWGVVIFRFLRNYSGRDGRAFVLAVLALLILPVAAFPFQVYPEVAAGIALFLVCNFILHYRSHAPGRDVLYGMICGYLPWLHVRFAIASAILVVWCVATRTGRRPAALRFCAGYGLVLGALCLYTYHITGSLVPSAPYYAEGSTLVVFSAGEAARGLVGMAFDATYGLLAHAPLYGLALLGVWPLIRKAPSVAIPTGLVILAVAIPAAGHSWTGNLTTPLRLVVAVLPLSMIALMEAVERFERRAWFRVSFGALAVLSVHNAFSYNYYHQRQVAELVAAGFSGWRTNLLFPSVPAAFAGHAGAMALLVLVFCSTGVLVCLPSLTQGFGRASRKPAVAPTPWGTGVLAALLIIVLAGEASGRLQGRKWAAAYRVPVGVARADIRERRDDHGSTVRFSSLRGRLDRRDLERLAH